MPDLIRTTIDAAGITSICKSLDETIDHISPHYQNLTAKQKQGIRTMSTNREGLARLVDGIANANIDSLPRNIDPTRLTDKLTYKDNLVSIQQRLLKLTEMVTEIGIANGVDIMKLTDTISNNLQSSRNNDGALDLAMAPVDAWNKRFANTEETLREEPDEEEDADEKSA